MDKKQTVIWFIIISLLITGCYSEKGKNKSSNIQDNFSNLNVPSLMLHVEGNKIVNSREQEVRLTGVNVCSLEWNNKGDNVTDSVYEVFANWNCNIVRLPLSQDRWFGKLTDWSTTWKTQSLSDGGVQYRKIVDDVVEIASSFGKYVIIDLHWSNAGAWGENIGQHYMPDENSLEFWIDAAVRYANRPAVLFNLYNEPHDISWEVWKDGGTITEILNKGKDNEKTVTYVTPGHQNILNNIRAHGANNIVIAGGIDWAYDLQGIADSYALVDTADGNGIVYDSHIYPWKEWDGRNHNSKVLCIADNYPVIIGETGIDPYGEWGTAGRPFWLSGILNWFDDNNLHWTGWTFHTGATPSIISDWNYTPSIHLGVKMKERLLSYPDTNTHLKKLPEKL